MVEQPFTKAIKYIDGKAHGGNAWVCGKVLSLTAGTASGVSIVVANGKKAHSYFRVAGGDDVKIHLYDSPTLADNGSGVEVVNLDRNFSGASNVSVYEKPNVTASGTQIVSSISPDEGEWRFGEVILSGSNILEMVNKGAAAEDVAFEVKFYEE